MSDTPHLTLGSTYHVRSMGTRDEMLDTRGTFKGVVSVGSMDGLGIELDESHGNTLAGKLRVIPNHMVLAIDVLEPAEREEDEAEEDHIQYG